MTDVLYLDDPRRGWDDWIKRKESVVSAIQPLEILPTAKRDSDV